MASAVAKEPQNVTAHTTEYQAWSGLQSNSKQIQTRSATRQRIVMGTYASRGHEVNPAVCMSSFQGTSVRQQASRVSAVRKITAEKQCVM
ncbi:hypothetical protein Gpo141_00013776 [Globisporangium polare]